MEVAPGIHRIETPLGERFVCLFLLVGDEGALLVDTGMNDTIGEHLEPYLDSIGLEPSKIRYVLNTHADFDHMGGNSAARKLAPDALFMCHVQDRAMIEDIDFMITHRYGEFAADHGIDDTEETKAWIRANAHGVPINLALAGGEELRLGADWHVRILHTPGHSWGHVTVYDPRSRTAIIADAALWHGVVTKDGAPAFPPTYRYLDTYLASAQWFQSLPIDLLLTSHYPVFQGTGVAEFLGETRAFTDRVNMCIRDELQASREPRSMKQLIEALAPKLGEWPEAAHSALVYPLLGHMEWHVRHGWVTTDREGDRVTYRWTR